MPRVSVPPDRDPMMYVWGELAKGLTAPAAQFSEAVYHQSCLPLREFEAARVSASPRSTTATSASTGGPLATWPVAAKIPNEVPEEFYANIGTNPTWSGFSPRERLSAEFAGRFAVDHLNMDDAFWAELHEHFSDERTGRPRPVCRVVGGLWAAQPDLRHLTAPAGSLSTPRESSASA